VARTAQCQCGSLRAVTSGEPLFSYLCHCQSCQRRSGTIVQSGAHYLKTQVECRGVSKAYSRKADSGFEIRFYFCPECGSTVYWETSKYPDRCGIAVGCFADPTFPPPTLSMYEHYKHHWLSVPPNIEHLTLGISADGRPMEKS
jgi:hypothetical protein